MVVFILSKEEVKVKLFFFNIKVNFFNFKLLVWMSSIYLFFVFFKRFLLLCKGINYLRVNRVEIFFLFVVFISNFSFFFVLGYWYFVLFV